MTGKFSIALSVAVMSAIFTITTYAAAGGDVLTTNHSAALYITTAKPSRLFLDGCQIDSQLTFG